MDDKPRKKTLEINNGRQFHRNLNWINNMTSSPQKVETLIINNARCRNVVTLWRNCNSTGKSVIHFRIHQRMWHWLLAGMCNWAEILNIFRTKHSQHSNIYLLFISNIQIQWWPSLAFSLFSCRDPSIVVARNPFPPTNLHFNLERTEVLLHFCTFVCVCESDWNQCNDKTLNYRWEMKRKCW